MKEYSVVGKNLPKVDAVAKATGEAIYTADMVLPGMLHGKILRSPLPHAKILNIDTSKAKKLRGVRGVITGKDTAGKKIGVITALPENVDEPGIAIDKVRYIGDAVAAVAAIDKEIAEEALSLIKVDYEELPAVFDPVEAMKPDAPKIHEVERNICIKAFLDFGDVDKGFKEADYVREDSFTAQKRYIAAMEPRAALASVDLSGKITIWPTLQSAYKLRRNLATLLDIPQSQLRVIRPFIGGGFGGKLDLLPVDFCAALLAKNIGKPVKIVHTRKEDFIASRQKHPAITKVKTGVKKDGTMVASEINIIFDTGAYAATGPIICYTGGGVLTLTYRVPNVRYLGYCVYTNKTISSSHRGFGAQQIRFGVETQVDMIAEELGLDPMEMRLKNATQPGDITASKYRITSNGLEECIRESGKKAGWKDKRGKMKDNQGVGMGCTGYLNSAIIPTTIVPHDSGSALVKVDEIGTATLSIGAVDIGQGSDTTVCQIVAEELGIALEDIRLIAADTDLAPLDLGTFGSRVTFIAGNAAKAAAKDAKQQLFEVVAKELEAREEDLEAKDRRIYVKGSPEKGMSFVDAVLASLMTGKPILGRGYFHSPQTELVDPITGQGNVSPTYNFGAVVAEVKVDTETGKIKVTKTTAAQDVGFAINPQNCEGQLEGSIADSLGQTLYEEVIEKDGKVLNPSLFDYSLPRAPDMPEIENILVETIDPEGPFGAKGMSEATVVPPVPAIANAIYDAIGVRIKELPITPEKILKALKEKKGGKK